MNSKTRGWCQACQENANKGASGAENYRNGAAGARKLEKKNPKPGNPFLKKSFFEKYANFIWRKILFFKRNTELFFSNASEYLAENPF